MGIAPILPSYLMDRGIENYEFVRLIANVIRSTVTVSTVYFAYRFGKSSELDKEYRDVSRNLVYGLVSSLLLLGLLYFVSGDSMKDHYQMIFLMGMPSSYRVVAQIFAAICVGWLMRDGIKVEREWNPEIRIPVFVYTGALLLKSLVLNVAMYQLSTSGTRTSISWTLSLLNWGTFPFWLWYMNKMLSSGKAVDLESDMGGILYTLWVPSVVLTVLNKIFNMAYDYLRYDDFSLIFKSLQSFGVKLIMSPFGVFGLPLALLCYGYFITKYRAVPWHVNKEEPTPDESSV